MRPVLHAFVSLTAVLLLSLPGLRAVAAGPASEAAPPSADAVPGPEAEECIPPAVETFDDQARFIAGLPVSEGSPLAAVEAGQDWQDYARALEADWATIKAKRLDAMTRFAAEELAPKIDPKANLFYFFGGPDLLSAVALYPDAPVYVLAGLEPVGKVPQITTMRKDWLDRAIGNLRTSIRNTVRSSFFRTNDMAADLSRTEFKGVLPILLLFASRADFKVLDVQLIELDDQGAEHPLSGKARTGKPRTTGVRLQLLKQGREQEQTVYYLRQNVENSVLKATPGFLAFFQKRAPANHFFKAASFILHNKKRFSTTRDFVLENALSILQDDSGVPYELLEKPQDRWTVHLYGRYLRPLPPFTGHYQTDLAKAFQDGPVAPLPFVTGYRHPGEANLVLAIGRREGTPAPEPAKKDEAAVAPAPAAEPGDAGQP